MSRPHRIEDFLKFYDHRQTPMSNRRDKNKDFSDNRLTPNATQRRTGRFAIGSGQRRTGSVLNASRRMNETTPPTATKSKKDSTSPHSNTQIPGHTTTPKRLQSHYDQDSWASNSSHHSAWNDNTPSSPPKLLSLSGLNSKPPFPTITPLVANTENKITPRKNFKPPNINTRIPSPTVLTPISTLSLEYESINARQSTQSEQPLLDVIAELITCIKYKSGKSGKFLLPDRPRDRAIELVTIIKSQLTTKPASQEINESLASFNCYETVTNQISKMQDDIVKMQHEIKNSLDKSSEPVLQELRHCRDELVNLSSLQNSTLNKQQDIINKVNEIAIEHDRLEKPLYSDILKQPKKSPPPILIPATNDLTTTDIIKQIESNELKIFPTKLFKNNEVIEITCKTEKHLLKTEEALQQLQLQFKYKQRRKLSLIFFNVPKHYECHEITEIIQENVNYKDYENDLEDIQYYNPRPNSKNQDTLNHFLRVPYKLAIALLKRNNIFVGTNRVNIRKRIFLSRCDWCQTIGHKATTCNSEHPRCAICNQSHLTSDCTSNYLQCHNCYHERYVSGENSLDFAHKASDRNCPTYKKIFKKHLIDSIASDRVARDR